MFLNKGAGKDDLATKLREELRKDATELREELKVAEHELDAWKEKYFLLMQDYIEIKHTGPGSPKGGNDEEI